VYLRSKSIKKSVAWGQQTSPHCVSALWPCGKHHGGRPPAARVTAQHLVLSQLYQILESLLIHLHTHTHCSDTVARLYLQQLGQPSRVEPLDISPQASSRAGKHTYCTVISITVVSFVIVKSPVEFNTMKQGLLMQANAFVSHRASSSLQT